MLVHMCTCYWFIGEKLLINLCVAKDPANYLDHIIGKRGMFFIIFHGELLLYICSLVTLSFNAYTTDDSEMVMLIKVLCTMAIQ